MRNFIGCVAMVVRVLGWVKGLKQLTIWSRQRQSSVLNCLRNVRFRRLRQSLMVKLTLKLWCLVLFRGEWLNPLANVLLDTHATRVTTCVTDSFTLGSAFVVVHRLLRKVGLLTTVCWVMVEKVTPRVASWSDVVMIRVRVRLLGRLSVYRSIRTLFSELFSVVSSCGMLRRVSSVWRMAMKLVILSSGKLSLHVVDAVGPADEGFAAFR